MSRSQKRILLRVFKYFQKIAVFKQENNRVSVTLKDLLSNGIKPMQLLLTGDPGSGKSYVIETICELAQIMKVGFVGITSYNGIAVAMLMAQQYVQSFQMVIQAKQQTTNF